MSYQVLLDSNKENQIRFKERNNLYQLKQLEYQKEVINGCFIFLSKKMRLTKNRQIENE